MSPNEFLYTISKECDRFKQSIIGKMEDYLTQLQESNGTSNSKASKVHNERELFMENSDWEESEDFEEEDDLPLKKIKKWNLGLLEIFMWRNMYL